MIAAVLFGSRDIRVETVGDPSIQSNEVLMKVKACGICGSDIHMYKLGDLSKFQRKPSILGHEFSGEIVEVGSAVRGLRVGDKVLGYGRRNCGRCLWCQRGQGNKCSDTILPGYGLDGAFAEYVVVPNPSLGKEFFHIPEVLGWEEAATIEPVAVACLAVEEARIQPNETVLILGAGMIGQGILQVCKARGATKIIVSEPSLKRLAMAKKLGADVALNPRKVNLVEAVMEVTSGEMANVAFECSGSPVAFRQALQTIRPFGRVMQVGVFEGSLEISTDLMSLMRRKNVTLRAYGGSRWTEALELVRLGKVRTRDLITHRFPLSNAKEAFETQLNADEAIKVLVKP